MKTVLKNGSTNVVTNNAVYDGLATKLSTEGGLLTGRIINRVFSFADGGATPSVKNGNIFNTGNRRLAKILGFDDGEKGQMLTIIIRDAYTLFVHGGGRKLGDLFLRGAQDFTGASGDTIQFICDGKYWMEITRSDNT